MRRAEEAQVFADELHAAFFILALNTKQPVHFGGQFLGTLGMDALTIIGGEVRAEAVGVEFLNQRGAELLELFSAHHVHVPRLGIGVGRCGLSVLQDLLDVFHRHGLRKECAGRVAIADKFGILIG